MNFNKSLLPLLLCRCHKIKKQWKSIKNLQGNDKAVTAFASVTGLQMRN